MVQNNTIPLSIISDIKKFIEKLDGIDLFVASQEGLPIEVAKTSREKAEAMAALAEDLLQTSDNIVRSLLGKQRLTRIGLQLSENTALVVLRHKDLTLSIEGKPNLLNEASRILSQYLNNKRTRCPECDYDLTLETHKCPNCSRQIPFLSSRCPFCGTNVHIKKCPKCGQLLTSDGKKVVEEEVIEQKPLLQVNVLMGIIIGGLLGYAPLQNPLMGLIGAISGAAVLYVASKKALTVRRIRIIEQH